jgi:chromosome segregation ATPase
VSAFDEVLDENAQLNDVVGQLRRELEATQQECAELHDALEGARMVIDEVQAKIRGRDQAAARDQVAAVVEAATADV